MTVQELLSVRNTVPFEPFRIIMTDGRAYEIRHPELLLIGTTASIIGIPAATGL